MKVSLHRRRQNLSLPPQTRSRKPGLVAILIALTTGTMAFAASHITHDPAPPKDDPAVAAANAKTEEIADMRIRAHLKKLQR